ncbi:MAG: glycosyltransferase family 4 protein [Chloroflexota bacterium]|nr:glycosyltransferase family 4 protein [Chloroflexota bacterium]MDE2908273.1 glycosyltransferase family 4 protein [Chloroflexota bacterium]
MPQSTTAFQRAPGRRPSARNKAPSLLYVANIPRFFLSHRLPLALAARDAGFNVQVAASDSDTAAQRSIRESGLPFYGLPLRQHGMNPVLELHTLRALRALYRELKPDLLHHISIKPVIYGGIAARFSGCRNVAQAMSGLGYVFVNRSARARLLNLISGPAFKLALGGERARAIFQNPDDLELFVERGLITRQRALVIRGSGVDENVFFPRQENVAGLPVVLFAGRLLWQKGISEFVEAARRLRGQARFQVAGYEEPTSPLNVSAGKLQSWAAEGLIEWLGARADMPAVYAQSNIVCLPSTYGEGVPKVLIEAAACARVCVTTDTPGCREIVRRGFNGLLVPPHDIDALTQALKRLIENPGERMKMGAAGRQIVLERFTLRQVIDETLALYADMLDSPSR